MTHRERIYLNLRVVRRLLADRAAEKRNTPHKLRPGSLGEAFAGATKVEPERVNDARLQLRSVDDRHPNTVRRHQNRTLPQSRCTKSDLG